MNARNKTAQSADNSGPTEALRTGAAAAVAFVLACGAAPSSEACQFAQDQDSMGQFNALSMNSLENELVTGLSGRRPGGWRVLTDHSLTEAAILPAVFAMLQQKGGKDLLRYAAACALPRGEAVVFDDGIVTLKLHGRFGLAPEWTSHGLSVEEELAVSACLIAHVNAFGRRVGISVRAHNIETTDEERKVYSVHEGAFFGSVATQEFYACTGDTPTTQLYQVAPDRSDRVCTDGDDKCSVEALGPCEDICTDYSEEFGWTQCRAPSGETFEHTANVFLMDRELIALCGE